MSHVCIYGLGEVGLRLACLCAKKGHDVYGIDVNQTVIDSINQGISHISDPLIDESIEKLKSKVHHLDNSKDIVNNSDIIIVSVPTPINEDNVPILDPLKSASQSILQGLKSQHLIIIESSVFPSTTEEVIKPILESNGMKAGQDFYLVHCPERIDPGNSKWNTENIPRILGAFSEQGAEKAKEFYHSILSSEIITMKSVREAEATKLMENIFRDVNIAYINEIAKLFDKLDIDTEDVIKAASTKPFGYMPFYPSPGVGGNCISVNTHYLLERANQIEHKCNILETTRLVNDSMAPYVLSLIKSALEESQSSKVTVLGTAYKKNVESTLKSPALKIIDLLKKNSIDTKVYDPHVKQGNTVQSLDEALNTDCIVLAVDHSLFSEITPYKLKEKGVKAVVDCRSFFDKSALKQSGLVYRGIGRGK